MKILWAGLLCVSIGACKRTDAPATPLAPPAASASTMAAAKPLSPEQQMKADLMLAVFDKAYRAASGDALAELPDNDEPKNHSKYVVTPEATTVLANGNTVLVANAENVGEDGKADSGHTSRGLLNVYILKQDGSQWKVLKRHENVVPTGAYGQLGEVSFVEIGPNKPGMVITYGDSAQGASVGFFSLFDLGSEKLDDLTDVLTVRSDNEGACTPNTDKCWSVENKWHMVRAEPAKPYDDLVFEFSGYNAVPKAIGKKLTPEELDVLDDVERVKIAIGSKARYAFDGKVYRLVEGSNDVPEI